MKNLIPGMFSSVTDAELMLAINSYDDDGAENTVSDITTENSRSTLVIDSNYNTAANKTPYCDSTEDGPDDFFK